MLGKEFKTTLIFKVLQKLSLFAKFRLVKKIISSWAHLNVTVIITFLCIFHPILYNFNQIIQFKFFKID